MAQVIIKALNKSDACANRKLWMRGGWSCNLKIIAMTPAKTIREKIQAALGLSEKQKIKIKRVVFLYEREPKLKTWEFESENETLAQVFRRYHEKLDTIVKGAIAKIDEEPEDIDVMATRHAEEVLKNKSLCFEIEFEQ